VGESQRSRAARYRPGAFFSGNNILDRLRKWGHTPFMESTDTFREGGFSKERGSARSGTKAREAAQVQTTISSWVSYSLTT
jgi:hypothetical protein